MVGDASGKRSESDGYSGWDARAVRAEAARLALKAGMMEGQPKDLPDGPQATLARALGQPSEPAR